MHLFLEAPPRLYYDDPDFAAFEEWEDTPIWPSEFTYDQAKELRILAQREGVELGTRFTAALDVQANYDAFYAHPGGEEELSGDE